MKNPSSRQWAASYKAKSSNRRYSKFQLDHLWKFCFEKVVEIEKGEFDNTQYATQIESY